MARQQTNNVPVKSGMYARGGHATRSAAGDIPGVGHEFMQPRVPKRGIGTPASHDGMQHTTREGVTVAHVTSTTLNDNPMQTNPLVEKNLHRADPVIGHRSRRLEVEAQPPGRAHAAGMHPEAIAFHHELGRRVLGQAVMSGSTVIKGDCK
jgi:hypothetical protein